MSFATLCSEIKEMFLKSMAYAVSIWRHIVFVALAVNRIKYNCWFS